ncbi:cytochrome-c oxidase, cbb3-type subunit I, partial [Rhizobium ruizarguesonis]
MNYTTETMVIAVAAFLALLGAAFAHDHLFAVHMGILCFCLAVGAALLVRNVDFSPAGQRRKVDISGYFDEVIRYGLIATVFWGVVGFLVGVVIALQLAFPDLNIAPYLNFGRLRPVHTSAV